jgi:hypothetical protein
MRDSANRVLVIPRSGRHSSGVLLREESSRTNEKSRFGEEQIIGILRRGVMIGNRFTKRSAGKTGTLCRPWSWQAAESSSESSYSVGTGHSDPGQGVS